MSRLAGSIIITAQWNAQWNLRSMAPREGNMKTILHDPIMDRHILGITEKWLCNEFGDAAISIEGYVYESVDREDRELPFYKDGGGGIIVYISTGIPYTRREDLESKNVESIWIELTPKHHPSHLLCCLQKPRPQLK